MLAEFLLALDDGTWKSVWVDDAPQTEDRETLVRWFEDNRLGMAMYRNVLVVQLMALQEEFLEAMD